MEMNQYYNAKPSKISNLGADMTGAKRMNFDTYESDAEREKRKQGNRDLKAVKEAIKSEILADSVSAERLIQLYAKQFDLLHGFSPLNPDSCKIILERRHNSKTREEIAEFNKMVRAYNQFNRTERRFQCRFAWEIKRLRAKYQPKESFVGQSGKTFNWKEFNSSENDIAGKVEYLAENSKAVQFGNSVSDKERGYILIELTKFLKHWEAVEELKALSLKPLAWSFGARGNAQSVAYYQPGQTLISVNRNNIGSLVHEVGHYLDYSKSRISSKISYKTVNEYRESIREGLSSKMLNYYCKREEIFARAFEAYCFEISAGFSVFAQFGKDKLPKLNDELRSLVKEALSN